ncbi:MAG: NrtA/SsuA/CpmA family ABC transporter substrate-binding protein [Betaproteobacteria bacterium]|nr:NrtA/SsuA/CpmA family ABC transporter substrate-binding protein [Betaproteobacteria bacterium]
MKTVWRPVVLAAIAALTVSVGLLVFPGTGKTDRLRLAAYDGDVGALEWIAKEKGFFDKAGLDVDITGYASGRETMEAITAGRADVATASEFVVATRSFTEPGLLILGSICQYWNKGLIGRRDRGVFGAADLRGKRVGVTLRSTAEHNLVVFLAQQGLTLNDVLPVDLPPKEIVEQMGSGEIDAAITWQPHVAAIEKRLGGNASRLPASGADAYLLVLTRRHLLTEKPAAMEKLLRGLVLAETWVRAHPAEAKAWIGAHFSLDADYVEMQWPNMQLKVGLSQEILEAMDGEARWFAKKIGRQAIPNFAETVDAAALRAVKPGAVTIVGR